MIMGKKTFVTQPFLPPYEEFSELLQEVWESKWLTNNGKFHNQFETELAKFLGVKYVSLFANGTLALITALQALKVTGEVITTPFSFVATSHSLSWNDIKPVFVDIETRYCNIDSEKIESAITPSTSAILPVHVYGNPCNLEKIQRISDVYGIPIIYDAAHAFGVEINGNSVLNYGNLSILSFHATKVFNTFEGGAIICHDKKTKERIDYLKNFGIVDELTVVGPGINAKMTEFQAALGLLQLRYFDEITEKSKNIAKLYRQELSSVSGIRLLNDIDVVKHNYSYFPIFIDKERYGRSRENVYNLLKEEEIIARRYFYPLISQFLPYRDLPSSKPENLENANKIAQEVLCLPIFPDLELSIVEKVIDVIKR